MTGLKSEDVWEAYEGENYQCIDTGTESGLCYIFFSSNGLYFPDEKEVFERVIRRADRYEWKWVAAKSGISEKAGRVIYVRDVFKDWYSLGISKEVNTLDKTLDLLRKLSEGYKVITVGSSAGGYMAVLAAVRLHAAWCINFSGQYKVRTNVKEEYKDLSVMLRSYDGRVFYYVPIYSEQDQDQYELVKGIECIKGICFKGRKHADTMLVGNMPYIIGRDDKELLLLYEHYKGQQVGKISFLFRTIPMSKVLPVMNKEIKGFIKRRITGQDTGA